MYFLTLESSGKAASAAISEDARIISFAYLDIGLTHSETLMPLCDRVFAGASLRPADIGCFAATVGPGSFTGLRIGIAALKGMALAVDKPCVGVPVNDALARAAARMGGTAITVSDARAGRVFAAAYDVTGAPCRLCDDLACPIDELQALMPHGDGRYIFVGDAAALCYNAFNKQYQNCIALDRLPDAALAAKCAYDIFCHGGAVRSGELAPQYLQPSQAERNLKK